MQDLQSSLERHLPALVEAVGGEHAPEEVAAFVGDALNKAVRVGRELKQAQVAAGASDSDAAPSRALLRSPIATDFAATDLNRFYDNALNRIVFPALDVFFSAELAEYDQTKGAPTEQARQTLDAARIILAVLKQDPDFTYQENLREVFLLSLGPEDINIRGMALEFAVLFPEPPLTFAQHYHRLAEYWKVKLGDRIGECGRRKA